MFKLFQKKLLGKIEKYRKKLFATLLTLLRSLG